MTLALINKNRESGKKHTYIQAAQWLVIISLVFYCEYAVRSGKINRLFLASPSQIVEEFLYMIKKNILMGHLIISLQEFAVGYTLAIIAGILLGLLFVLFPKFEEFLSIFCSAFMSIPKSAILPLLIVWFGIGFQSKVLLIFMFCVFTILFNTVTGAKLTKAEHLKVARVFLANRWQTVFKVLVPSALPTIFISLRITASTALTSVIFAEMTAAKKGLGYLLNESQQVLNTPRLFVVILITTILSVILVSIVNLIEYLICHKWRAA